MTTRHGITPLYRYMRDIAQATYPAYRGPTPLLGFVRDDELISVVIVPSGSPDDVTAAAMVGAIGYKPHGISLLNEAYETDHMLNPLTNKPWERDEMAEVFVNDGGLGGVVTEAMVCSYVSNGKAEFLRQQFDRKEDDVTWGKEEIISEYDDEAEVRGAIPDLLRDVLADPEKMRGFDIINNGLANAMKAFENLSDSEDIDNKMDFITSAMMSAAGMVPLWHESVIHDVDLAAL